MSERQSNILDEVQILSVDILNEKARAKITAAIWRAFRLDSKGEQNE